MFSNLSSSLLLFAITVHCVLSFRVDERNMGRWDIDNSVKQVEPTPEYAEYPIIREMRGEIGLAFDRINQHIEVIIERGRMSNGLSDPPVKNRTECAVSKEELVKLRDQIQDMMKNVSSTKGSCDYPQGTVDNCDSWLRLIQCGIEELGDGFKNATSGSATLEEISKWKNAYNTLLDKYKKDIDNVRTSLSEEYQKKIDQLTTELENLSNAITKMEEELKQIYVKLCVSQLSSGKYDDAVAIFKKLRNDTLLDEIITRAFNEYGQKANVNNIIAFVKKLPRCALDKRGFPVLYNLMKASQTLVKPEVVTFYQAVRQCMCKSDLYNELAKLAA